MAIDTLFNFYEILVNSIFGSVILAILAVGIIMILILMLCRASSTLMFYWMTIYGIVMISMWLGAIGLIVGFISGVIYFVWGILRIIAGE